MSVAEITTVPPAGDAPAILRVAGELDLAAVPQVRAAFATVEADGPAAMGPRGARRSRDVRGG